MVDRHLHVTFSHGDLLLGSAEPLHSALAAWAGFIWRPGAAGTPRALARMDRHGLSTWGPSQPCWVGALRPSGRNRQRGQAPSGGQKATQGRGPKRVPVGPGQACHATASLALSAQGGPAGAPPLAPSFPPFLTAPTSSLPSKPSGPGPNLAAPTDAGSARREAEAPTSGRRVGQRTWGLRQPPGS